MITKRPLTTPEQQEQLLAFVRRDPHRHRHIVDLEYRLCSPAAQIPDNTCVWSLPDGDIVGFAIIQRQFWTIDYGTSAVADSDVFADILAWANERMENIADQEQNEYPDGIMNFFDCFVDDSSTRLNWKRRDTSPSLPGIRCIARSVWTGIRRHPSCRTASSFVLWRERVKPRPAPHCSARHSTRLT